MTPLKVHLVEDNPGDARLIQEILKEAPIATLELIHSRSLAEVFEKLDRFSGDVILLDLGLPDANGMETYLRMNARAPQIPIIILTGMDDEKLAVEAAARGAQEYLVKGDVDYRLLLRTVRYAVERKRAEEKIREQAALLDKASDAILVIDLQDHVQFWNQSAEIMYGISAGEAAGKDVHELLHSGPASALAEAKKAASETDEWRGELQQKTRGNETLTVDSRWTVVRDHSGNPRSTLIINSNVTEKKKLENQVLRAQRTESIGTLASGVAHDLNNILAPILMSIGLLRSKLDDQAFEETIQTIEQSAQRGADILKQLLTFSRGIEGRRGPIEPGLLVRDLTRMAKETFPKNISIQVDLDGDIWNVVGDFTQLHQVLLNLFINARDAMPSGGKLSLRARNVAIGEFEHKMQGVPHPGSYVLFSVEDTGTGIPSEIIDKIFDPFFTTKEFGRGTGLGLSTVVGIVKSHGGAVHVESEVGKGTRFDVLIPALPGALQGEAAARVENLPTGNEELVMMVDDESYVRDSTRKILERSKYRVITAAHAAEALNLARRHGRDLAAVVTDVMMPGLDPVALVRGLKTMNPGLPIIVSTGLGKDEKLEQLKAAGAEFLLVKPYTADQLVRQLAQALRK